MKKNQFIKKVIIFFLIFYNTNKVFSEEVYFDLSEKDIQVQTDFNGKEIIIFGVLKKNHNVIIAIKGPEKDTKVLKKDRILGFWFNTKKVIYKQIPSLFFISSSAPIKEILNQETIIKEKLYFDELLINTITQRDFIDQKNLKNWNENLINIKKFKNLYKEYNFENIDNKLFQTRVFFPANSITGDYTVTIYQIRNNVIIDKKNKVININKAGIGEIIYSFANEKPAVYGVLVIFFAIVSGFLAATAFRRL